MFYELHELVVFINNQQHNWFKTNRPQCRSPWQGNQNIRISPASSCLCTNHFMWKQTPTLPQKTFRAKRVFRVWLDIILVTTRVQEKVPHALGPLSISKLSVPLRGLLFPGTCVSVSIYLPIDWAPSFHAPVRPWPSPGPVDWNQHSFLRLWGRHFYVWFSLTLSTNPLRYCCTYSTEKEIETKRNSVHSSKSCSQSLQTGRDVPALDGELPWLSPGFTPWFTTARSTTGGLGRPCMVPGIQQALHLASDHCMN